MKISVLLFLVILISCGQPYCPPDINKQPQYGQVKKCPEQIEIDNSFLKECAINFENREIAAKYYVDRGWGYYYNSHFDSAMFRFNQAWLLDSLNADTYWGFGNLLGQRGEFKESLEFFEKSLVVNPNNSNVWLAASTSYGQVFFQTKDKNLLDKTIKYLKKSVSIDPQNVAAYSQLTAAYTYFTQKDSAKKYLQITDKLDSNVVSFEVRQIINN